MSASERVQAALSGEPVDHPPVSLWRHFPEHDQTAGAIAEASLAQQRTFGFDFIKLMPPGDYPTIDWGAKSVYRGSPNGTRTTIRYPVGSIDDWRRIQPVPVDRGMNHEVVDAVRLVTSGLPEPVPVLQTVFSPLTIAAKLSNGLVLEHLHERPDVVREALAVITDVTRAVVTASLERGAAGIFFATQYASTDRLSADDYATFGTPYDLAVLEAAAHARYNILHIHGANILFEQLMTYPVHALNWHDRRTRPMLAEGERLSQRCVTGGIDEQAVATMSPDAAAAQPRRAVADLGGRHLMVAPGCVIPVATPDQTVHAVVAAVRSGGSDG